LAVGALAIGTLAIRKAKIHRSKSSTVSQLGERRRHIVVAPPDRYRETRVAGFDAGVPSSVLGAGGASDATPTIRNEFHADRGGEEDVRGGRCSPLLGGDGYWDRPHRRHRTPGPDYRHHASGEDNGDAHLKNLLIGHQVIVPVTGGKLDLGPWQQIFYFEFDGRRRKRLILKAMGV
jgi:hypothetical protein